MTQASSPVRTMFDAPPAAGEWREVGPGVFWARVALPFRLNHVNVYLIDDGEAWNIVDTGIANSQTEETWNRLLSGRMDGRRVSKVVATHHHPDHVGLASVLADKFDAEVVMSGTEYLLGLTYWLDSDAMKADHYRAFYRMRGLDAETAEAILDRSARYQSLTGPLPFSFRRVIEGDTLRLGARAFHVITGGGHAPEQVMLYSPDDRILFAADQIMLSITPNVSVSPRNPNGDVLGLFLASLERMAGEFDEDILVLPGHHRPFKGLPARVREVTEHHDDRLARIVKACAQAPRSAADLLKTLFRWPLDRGVMALAFGESCAHVNRLLEEGRITAALEDDGVERYTA